MSCTRGGRFLIVNFAYSLLVRMKARLGCKGTKSRNPMLHQFTSVILYSKQSRPCSSPAFAEFIRPFTLMVSSTRSNLSVRGFSFAMINDPVGMVPKLGLTPKTSNLLANVVSLSPSSAWSQPRVSRIALTATKNLKALSGDSYEVRGVTHFRTVWWHTKRIAIFGPSRRCFKFIQTVEEVLSKNCQVPWQRKPTTANFS